MKKRPLTAAQRKRQALREQHKAARREADKLGFKLVPEPVAQLIRAAGGPMNAPVCSPLPFPTDPEFAAKLLTGMPQLIVARIQSPPPEYAGLKLETIVMLAVEEWKAHAHERTIVI